MQRAALLCKFPLLLLFCQTPVLGAAIDWPQLNFVQVASGVSAPTSIADPGDRSGRLFATEQKGQVLLIQSNTVTPFLDIQDRTLFFANSELGLLSVAFPPGFATNHYFYVFYNGDDLGAVVSRFYVSSTNANVADPSTEQQVLVIPPDLEAMFRLSGGCLVFGPDGNLYVGVGDSGFTMGQTNRAQNTQTFQGKILRIDVESSTNAYRVPPDNPFVGNPHYLPEIWALGMRNPFKFTFDHNTGDFYLGDVGQLESEEVDFKAAGVATGQNYGWPIREGLHLYEGPDQPGIPLTDPILEYLHTGPPASITGGYVYRGPLPSRMNGIYFYADAYSGKIWGLTRDGTNWVNQLLARQPYFITSFGQDQAGQLYVADYISGSIYRMEDGGAVVAPSYNPPGTNSFTETVLISSISTNAVIHYTTNGIDPVATDPGINSGDAVIISSGATLKARAFRAGLAPSAVTSATFNLKTARPFFNPAVGPATNGQLIAIGCATPGAAIHYTLDGTEPSIGSPLYAMPISYASNATIKAAAFKANFANGASAIFSSAPLLIQDFNSESDTLLNSFIVLSQPGWNYQLQVGEYLGQWRNFAGLTLGTNTVNGFVHFNYDNVYPLPLRHFFRVQGVPDPGL